MNTIKKTTKHKKKKIIYSATKKIPWMKRQELEATAKQRRETIIQLLQEQGFYGINQTQLAKQFNVSSYTISHDLEFIKNQNIILIDKEEIHFEINRAIKKMHGKIMNKLLIERNKPDENKPSELWLPEREQRAWTETGIHLVTLEHNMVSNITPTSNTPVAPGQAPLSFREIRALYKKLEEEEHSG